MSELVSEYHMTGNCVVNIDLIEKKWDHRFVLYDYENQFQFVKFLRRGSESREVKCDISNEQAQEIIKRLSLVRSTGMSPNIGSWRKKGMSDWDMRRVKKTK